MDAQVERHAGVRSCAFATSLLDGGASVGVGGPTPSLAVVMSEVRHLA